MKYRPGIFWYLGRKHNRQEEISMGFDQNFLWGAASADYQVEGAYLDDGKGLGIWDALSEGHVKHGDNGNVACDHYHRFREDIALMKQIGLKAYRFSVSWPRVMPEEGRVNGKGVAFYKELVRELTEAGIQPMCTLFHWNLPMWAYEKGGWLWDGISDAFADFARVVVDALSDSVSVWMTLNEPACFIGAGYLYGFHAPFEKHAGDEDRTARLVRNTLLAHGKALSVIRSGARTAPRIGLALNASIYTPVNGRSLDEAKKMTFADPHSVFCAACWMDPIVKGELPDFLKGYVSEEDLKVMHQPIDFFGYNCYSSSDYEDNFAPNPLVYPGMPRTAMGWAITPDALYWAARIFHDRYHLPILITENGMANIDFVMSDGMVHDPQRIEYLKGYIRGLRRAAEEGIPVMGYMYWSIMDNFEWADGYDKRFGLIHVDYGTQKRTLKDSALWYGEVIRSNGDCL